MTQQFEDDVPVTAALLSLVLVLRQAATLYRSESILAEQMSMDTPLDWLRRCEDLFYKTYAEQAKKAGLSLNAITFETIFRHDMPEEIRAVAYEDLPKQWVFNPWRGWRNISGPVATPPISTAARLAELEKKLSEANGVVSILYHALDDASTVVDPSDDEDYAYQAELEAGAAQLGISRQARQRERG